MDSELIKQVMSKVAGRSEGPEGFTGNGTTLSRSEASLAGQTQQPQGGKLPKSPGFKYLNHLFTRGKARAEAAAKAQKSKEGGGSNIYADQMEALKTAVGAIGIYSDRNPGGMPINVKDAKKVWFGDRPVAETEEAEWRSSVELGDKNLDPKRVRKFVNYDGSMTWEILNQDKTVMSRFTMGEWQGTKVFAQGGYNKFVDALKKVQAQGDQTEMEFESSRSNFGGV